MTSIPVSWPDGHTTQERIGQDWLVAANEAGISIPTGCLGGSCGACEIEVNGKVVRPASARCRHQIREVSGGLSPPHW